MAEVAMEVPAALVPCMRETALMQYRAAVEALHLAFGAHGEAGASAEDVRRGRARLRQLDALLDQLGWPGVGVPRALHVAAPAEVLRGALARRGDSREHPLGGRGGDRPRPAAAPARAAALGRDRAAEEQEADHG